MGIKSSSSYGRIGWLECDNGAAWWLSRERYMAIEKRAHLSCVIVRILSESAAWMTPRILTSARQQLHLRLSTCRRRSSCMEDCLTWRSAQIHREFCSSLGRVSRLSAVVPWHFRDYLHHSAASDRQQAKDAGTCRSCSWAVACVAAAAVDRSVDESCRWSQLARWVEAAVDIYCTRPQCLESVIAVAFCVKLSVAVMREFIKLISN